MNNYCYRYVIDDSADKNTPLCQCKLRQAKHIPSSMLAYRVKFPADSLQLNVHKGKAPSDVYETITDGSKSADGLLLGEMSVPVIRTNGIWRIIPWLADIGPISDWHAALLTAGYKRIPRMGYLSKHQLRSLNRRTGK